MTQQRLIALLKFRLLRQVVDRRCHAIGAMQPRHPAKLPQRVLQPFAQAGEALRLADGSRFPVRIRQHEVVQHVRERITGNRDSQLCSSE